ncbi:heparinase II/III family protein [Psychroflexus sp. CAK1W]|uniref:heparinase II/III domain-containing protein n=1 Tax=Psychroflexus curvus TaxID=2873595 RepID=UPI001CCC5D27|nr:heparinase II/III family protein [Psychroflexus curvus]MBZ9629085.1 heparinase II/III family protein [Psychroflexus curvus]
MLKKLSLLLPLLPKLGYWNVAYMLWYRTSSKLGLRKAKFPLGNPVKGIFYKSISLASNYPKEWKPQLKERADAIMQGQLDYFHHHGFEVGNPPNWFTNPFEASKLNNPYKHWTELSDFDLNTGDIKILWEPSRFDWLTDLARAYKVFGDEKYLMTLNVWLQDWSQKNPKNCGPNWKCGQETAIRVMKLVTASQILDQDFEASQPLQQLIFEHLERISGNINYAIAQDNNHGTSETAGLYIGATFLLKQKELQVSLKKLSSYKKRGRKLLINRVLKLIARQGTFAQQSVTYHRVVVDTFSWVVYAMQRYNEPKFSNRVNERLLKLGQWQITMTANEEGNTPNLGSNDGAMFENLHQCDYRDFRPSTQLFFGVLLNKRVYNNQHRDGFDEALWWRYPSSYLNFPLYKSDQLKFGILDKQFLYVKEEQLSLYMRLPQDQFRPSSSDAFHMDLWVNGKNVLCDSGTYSYNSGSETDRFKSVTAHNTVQFGHHEQMPKISRFLYGGWLKASIQKPLEKKSSIYSFSASYKDHNQNKHIRSFELDTNLSQLTVKDTFEKSKETEATVFWHIPVSEGLNLKAVDQNLEILTPTISKSEASLYYLEKHPIQNLQFSSTTNRITTQISF